MWGGGTFESIPTILRGVGRFPRLFSLTTSYFTSPSPPSADCRLPPQVSPLSAVWFLQMSTRRGLCRWRSYPGLGPAQMERLGGPKRKYSTLLQHVLKPASSGSYRLSKELVYCCVCKTVRRNQMTLHSTQTRTQNAMCGKKKNTPSYFQDNTSTVQPEKNIERSQIIRLSSNIVAINTFI